MGVRHATVYSNGGNNCSAHFYTVIDQTRFHKFVNLWTADNDKRDFVVNRVISFMYRSDHKGCSVRKEDDLQNKI